MVDQQRNPHQQRHYRALSKSVDLLVSDVYRHLEKLSDAQLDQAYKMLNSLSTTNCSWTIYAVRSLLKELVDIEAKQRMAKRKEVV